MPEKRNHEKILETRFFTGYNSTITKALIRSSNQGSACKGETSVTERCLEAKLANSPVSESEPLPIHSVIMAIKVCRKMKQDGTANKCSFLHLCFFFAGKEMSMENVTNIKNEGLSRIEACESLADLQNLRVLY